MARVFLSLGSNLGDRLSNIQQAVRAIGMLDNTSIVKTSSFYDTEPWGNKKQNWFVNCAIAIDTQLSPEELLLKCQDIEHTIGRIRNQKERWQERAIDIDILMYDNAIITEENLVIPHPYMHERAFVLVPMLEVKPDLIHPVFKKTISQFYDELENPEDVFLYGTVMPRQE